MFKKILVAIDGSDQSKKALHYALVLSEKFSSELIILTVYHKRLLPMISTEDVEVETIDSDLQEKYWESIKEYHANILRSAEQITKRDWPSVKYVALLAEGRPSTEIISAAQRNEVDLIVLGSRGIHGATGWILGSTSKSVVDHCNKPVFIVK
jgi:nucleotide-binding universal stress UspA family protein